MCIVRSLGGHGGAYKRERSSALGAVVSELYSPPLVSAAARLMPQYQCIPGFALDLTTTDPEGKPWDFDDAAQRKQAWQKIESEEPMLIIGTPMCTAFSAWQRIHALRRDPLVVSREYARAMVHLRFCMPVYEYQVKHGRYFLHEHPAQAASWGESVTQIILKLSGVSRVVADMSAWRGRRARSSYPEADGLHDQLGGAP